MTGNRAGEPQLWSAQTIEAYGDYEDTHKAMLKARQEHLKCIIPRVRTIKVAHAHKLMFWAVESRGFCVIDYPFLNPLLVNFRALLFSVPIRTTLSGTPPGI